MHVKYGKKSPQARRHTLSSSPECSEMEKKKKLWKKSLKKQEKSLKKNVGMQPKKNKDQEEWLQMDCSI